MGKAPCPGSTAARLASTPTQADFFFQPVQLHLELADLAVKAVRELVVLGLFAGAAVGEEIAGRLLERLLPGRDLARMDLVLAGDLVDRFVAGEGFQGGLGLEFAGQFASFALQRFASS